MAKKKSKKTVNNVVVVNTATTTQLLPLPFSSKLPRPRNNDFLLNVSPYEESFRAALDTSYQGFVIDDNINMKEEMVQDSLHLLKLQNYFRRDVTQPFGLGTKCAKTYVTRCLVGDPGTTYKYLGLRMFAHPWNHQHTSTTTTTTSTATKSSTTGSSSTTQTIQKLSLLLAERTQIHLQELDQKRKQRVAPLTMQGKNYFDICLINCMDPSTMKGQQLKPEASPVTFPNQNLLTTVSWHADSSLEHYSTIAVYQTLVPILPLAASTTTAAAAALDDRTSNSKTFIQKIKEESFDQWYVAMRVTPHVEGPSVVGSFQRKTTIQSSVDTSIPPIAASLPSGSAYYLLDDFNHHHQHTVLLLQDKNTSSSTTSNSNSNIRYSCTFRLLRDSHNVDYMLRRCQSAVSHFHKKGIKVWRSEQLLLTEMESEWIRQFYIQGSQHYELLWHVYWKEPIRALLRYWSQLEQRTLQTIDLLVFAAHGKCLGAFSNGNPPSKAERKIREKQKKSLSIVQGLLQRSSAEKDTSEDSNIIADDHMYQSLAELLEERAQLRSLWGKREKDHVFSDLAPELRPMPLPFQYADNFLTVTTTASVGDTVTSSPLPGDPNKLCELAASLRAYGKAYVSGRTDDLPPPAAPASRISLNETPPSTTSCITNTNTTGMASDSIISSKNGNNNNNNNNNNNDPHSRPLDWPGWTQPNVSFGLELQEPWAAAVMDGRKEIETRSYPIPPALLGKRLWILETPSGTAGVSALGNSINLVAMTLNHKKNKKKIPNHGNNNNTHNNNPGCKVLGWCSFTSVIRYTSKAEFDADEGRHMVSSKSGYGWNDDGTTKVIFGWVVGERGPSMAVENKNRSRSFVSATRRMRSLFELKTSSSSSQRKSTLSSGNKKRYHRNDDRGSKKRRF